MRISNYSEVRDALHARESFRHGSCSGHRYPDGQYRVYSYSTPVLSVDATGCVVFFDNRRYSQTTTRLQSLIREAFPDATGGHSDRGVYDY